MTDSIIIYSQKNRLVFFLFISLAFLAAGLFMLFYTDQISSSAFARVVFLGSSALIKIAGILISLLSGAAAFRYLKLLFDSKPLLLVNQEGISDYSSLSALGFIPWEDIADVQLTDYSNNLFISLVLKEDEPYLAKMNWLQKRMSKINQSMTANESGSPSPLIFISLSASKAEPQTVFQQIKAGYADRWQDN